MAGGGGSPIARVIGQIDAVNNPKAGGPTPGFISPSQLAQGANYQSNYASQQISPLAQQITQRAMAPQPIMGLPAALMQMQGQLNQPVMRGPMPAYQNPALAYRPNMIPSMEALNRVVPSVAEQQRLQAIEDAKRAAEEEANRPAYTGYEGSNY